MLKKGPSSHEALSLLAAMQAKHWDVITFVGAASLANIPMACVAEMQGQGLEP